MLFILGMIVGFMLANLIALMSTSYRKRKIKILLDKVDKDIEALEKRIKNQQTSQPSIKVNQARFDQAREISKQQEQLADKAAGPSTGASHSLWKNQVRGELIEMEREKMDIFRAIVADGFDPKLKVMVENGDVVERAMSECIRQFDEEFPPEPKVFQKTTKAKNKLKLVELDKDDSLR